MKLPTRLCSILTFLPLIVSALLLPLMPRQIPAHYNLSGQIDRWGSPLELLLLPLLTLAAGLLARHLLIPHLMRKNPNNSLQALTAALCCVLAAFNLLTGAMLFSALSSGSFAEPGEAFIRIVNVLMGLMLIPMGNIMPKVKRNGAFGLRTRWSMANDACWNRCQRMGGLSLMVTGALIVLGALLLPPAYSTVLMLLLILLDAVFSTVYSYQVYQKYGRN